jgi:hypothetical protein
MLVGEMSTRFTHVETCMKKSFDPGMACNKRDGIKSISNENQRTKDENEDRSPKTRTT